MLLKEAFDMSEKKEEKEVTHTLSPHPVPDEYHAHHGKLVKHGRSTVLVGHHHTNSRSGSWERGFKFSSSKWGKLTRATDHQVSLNHGKSWHSSAHSAMKSKGKVKLEGETHGELAFDGIQKINRDYDPSYKWRR